MTAERALRLLGVACVFVAVAGSIEAAFHVVGAQPDVQYMSGAPQPLLLAAQPLLLFAGIGLLRQARWGRRLAILYACGTIALHILPLLMTMASGLAVLGFTSGLTQIPDILMMQLMLVASALDSAAFPLLLLGFMLMPWIQSALTAEPAPRWWRVERLDARVLFGGLNVLLGATGVAATGLVLLQAQWRFGGSSISLGVLGWGLQRGAMAVNVLLLLAGIGLLRRAPWGRLVAMAGAIVALTLHSAIALMTSLGVAAALSGLPFLEAFADVLGRLFAGAASLTEPDIWRFLPLILGGIAASLANMAYYVLLFVFMRAEGRTEADEAPPAIPLEPAGE